MPQEGKTPQLRRLAHNRIHAAIVQTNVLAETAFGIGPANTVRAFLAMPPNFSDGSIDGREIGAQYPRHLLADRRPAP